MIQEINPNVCRTVCHINYKIRLVTHIRSRQDNANDADSPTIAFNDCAVFV